MGLLSKSTLSWKRFYRLQKLEKTIAPPDERVPDVACDLTCMLTGGETREKEGAIVEFFDLCESDDGVRKVMEHEHLSRLDLKGIVVSLLTRGLGEWIKGHYAALSTIAYAEPLEYFVRAEQRGVSRQHIYFNLLEYWQGRIPGHELTAQLPLDSPRCEIAEATPAPQSH